MENVPNEAMLYIFQLEQAYGLDPYRALTTTYRKRHFIEKAFLLLKL